MKRYLLQILLCFCFSTALFSCVNEDMEEPALGKGESTLSVDIAFRPLSDPLTTRTAGDAIKHINDLSIVIYKADGTLHSCTHYTSSDFTTSEADYPNSLPQGTNGFAEDKTCKTSTISIPNVPYGKYRMYAVVNMNRVLTEAETASEEALRAIPLTWNAKSIASNNAMFGFFDTEANKATVGTSAPEITINAQAVSLHAWVKRAASKVTVAYDGSNLKENIYIYIHSAQIKDIPKTCYLGKENKPTAKDQLNSNGEMINYTNGATGTTVGLTVTKGNPKHGSDHSETADALFFFENMQGYTSADKGKFQDETGAGAVTHPYGSISTDPDYKDGVPYGSYIEVKGYYVNKSAENASQGNITYRFMLGRDVVRDCNAERNNHYKLTLRFKNDANNPDWHIDYTPENPTLSVPTPLYISYGYNEVLNIPVVVRGAAVNANTTIKATIIENPWGYPEHKYYNNSNHDDLDDGFLSFENLKGTVSISESTRNNWEGAGSSYVSNVKPTKVETDNCQYTVPVYTRPLILAQSLTGHNPYVSYQRKAKVRFEVVLNGQTVTQNIDVIQVKRLVNPTGVWRSANNTSKFNIRLMELPQQDTDPISGNMVDENFEAPLSDGPWTAHIEEGSDWVQIAPTNSGDWDTKDIIGGTGSEIRFDYRPKNANTTGSVRCGVIKITYHNNHCVHYVFVSQGLGTVNLAGTKWQNRNVYAQNTLVANPLLEGSMFKFGNPWWGILSENNHRNGYGFDQGCWGKTFWTTRNEDITFEGIGFNLDEGFTGDRTIFTTNTSIRPGSYEQWKALETLHRRYGVMYGDECTETMTTTTEAYCYYQEGQQRGMQGMFVWDESRNGNHIFFPIGSTGNGHRKVNDNAYLSTYGTIDKYSHLKYAQRPKEMPEATAKAVPMYYDIWLRKGAIYWYDVMYSPAVDFEGTESKGYAHDINFHSMLFQTFGSNPIGQNDRDGNKSTDAAYIRCVEN